MELKNQIKLKKSLLKALENFIDEQFNGNASKAAEYLGEDRKNFHKYLNGTRSLSLEKGLDLLEKTKKFEFTFKIKRP